MAEKSVSLGKARPRSAMRCIGQASQTQPMGRFFPTPSGPGAFGPWRRWLALVVG